MSKDKKENKEKKLEFLIGIPSKSSIGALFDDSIENWYRGHPVTKTKAVSNRVDWNRTQIWLKARELDTALIMFDTDVYPITPYVDVRNYLNEDFGKGYDVVFAPLLSHDGNLLFGVKNINDIGKDTPYEAIYSGFGFVAFSKKLIEELQPLTHLDIIDESLDMLKIDDENKKFIENIIKNKYKEMPPIEYHSLNAVLPIYFTYTAQLSEDSQFCRRVRKLGYKQAIDPRIKMRHMTEVPFVFDNEKAKRAIEGKRGEKQ